MNVDRYLNKQAYVNLYQIVKPNNRYRDINETHCYTLAKWFSTYNHYCARSMRKMYISSPVTLIAVTYANAVQNFDDMNLLNGYHCMIMPDEDHLRSSVK